MQRRRKIGEGRDFSESVKETREKEQTHAAFPRPAEITTIKNAQPAASQAPKRITRMVKGRSKVDGR